jgi:hypothetical protein
MPTMLNKSIQEEFEKRGFNYVKMLQSVNGLRETQAFIYFSEHLHSQGKSNYIINYAFAVTRPTDGNPGFLNHMFVALTTKDSTAFLAQVSFDLNAGVIPSKEEAQRQLMEKVQIKDIQERFNLTPGSDGHHVIQDTGVKQSYNRF